MNEKSFVVRLQNIALMWHDLSLSS